MSRIGDLLRQGMTGETGPASSRSPENQPPPPFSNTVFMHPANMALLTYWRMMKGVEALPAWGQIDLLEISEHLKNLMMLDWPLDRSPVIRFAGPQIVSWAGTDPANSNIAGLMKRDLCVELAREAARLRSAERLLLLQTKYDTRTGRSVLIEKLCMPLCDGDGLPHYLLVSCQWLSGSLRRGAAPDSVLPHSMTITQKILLPPEADQCRIEALDPKRRHPWVTWASSAG